MNPALPKTRWHYIYLLGSKVTDRAYLGCTNDVTNDLKTRLIEHKQGKVFTTKKMLPVELIYFEAYRSRDVAFEREKNLKKFGSGLARLKSRLGIAKKGRAG